MSDHSTTVTTPHDAAPSASIDLDGDGTDRITVQLLDIIRKHTKSAGESWNAATTLEDVGVDSFDLVELIFEIEDRYGISVNFNANRTVDDFATVADVARVIKENLGKEGRSA